MLSGVQWMDASLLGLLGLLIGMWLFQLLYFMP